MVVPQSSGHSKGSKGIRGAPTALEDLGSQTSSAVAEEPPLAGTSWTAVEIAFHEDPTAQQLDSVSLDHPITLSFESERARGSTGCNRYFGGFRQLSPNSFSTSGHFGMTRKYCRAVDEQERNYMRFLRNKMFYYKMIGDELILMENEPGPEEELVEEDNISARFRALDEDVE